MLVTAAAGGIVYSTSDAMGISSVGASGQVLTSGGTNAPTWVNASALTVGTSTVATTATPWITPPRPSLPNRRGLPLPVLNLQPYLMFNLHLTCRPKFIRALRPTQAYT